MIVHHLNLVLGPADELAVIRAEIKRLKEREAQLRRVMILEPHQRLGLHADVEVENKPRRVFCPNRLPQHIRNDPQYWETKYTRYVTVRSKRSASAPTAQGGATGSVYPARPTASGAVR